MASTFFTFAVFFILQCVIGQEDKHESIKVLSGQPVNLTCMINSTKVVIWQVDLGTPSLPSFVPSFTCPENGLCEPVTVTTELEKFNASRGNGTSILSVLPFRDEQAIKCELEGEVVKNYKISLIKSKDIKEFCNVSWSSINGYHEISLLCGFTFKGGPDLPANVTIEGIGPKNFQPMSESINRTVPLDGNFNNITSAYCKIYFPDIDLTKQCTYPAIIKSKYVVEGNGIIVESDDESEVDWHLFGKDGREEDIVNRTWTRDEGRSLLILGISEEDVGKLVVWRTREDDNQTNNGHDGTIGFTVISDIYGGSNNSDSKDQTSASPRAQSPFFVLTLLFLTLWLITFVVGGIILFCREEKCKTSLSDIPSTSGNERSPNSNQSSSLKTNRNVGSGENGTPLVRFTTEATNPDISNTNNSAHTPVLERDDGNDDTLNRQSQGNSHLYFTLEKSPSASFRRASAPRWTHGDASTATLDQDQDILWQGYATVGDSNENATCSYDLGEYAEVGEHLIQGKGPPVQSVRPPVRKKPGREEVKEDDISKLYGKVNK